MDASRRRTTMASHQQYQQSQQGFGSMTGLPMSMQSKRVFSGGSSAGGPSFGRQSLMPAGSASQHTGGGGGGGRFSMAVPQRVVSGGSMRQSMAPGMMMHSSASTGFPSSSQEQQHHLGASSQSQPQSSQNSRFSLAIPGTASKGAGMMSANRQDGAYLRSSMSQQQQQQHHSGQSQQQSSSQGYAPPSIRRSSSGRRQSTNPAHPPILQHFIQQPQRLPKDPRGVRDRQYQARCQNEILEFLRNSNYPDAHSLTGRTLSQPTGKEFANIFRYLYTLYDPSYKPDPKKKHEDEVLSCIRSSGYPFADSISKSHIQAVGTAMSWPGIIAMLHWLVSSIKAREQVLDNYDEVRIDANAPSQSTLEGYERPQAKTEFWAEYLSGLYPAFLASEDYDAQPYAERLEERFEMANEQSRLKVASLREGCEQLQAELDKLERTPSELDVKRKEQQDCEKDMNAINKYVAGLQDKTTRLARQIEEFKRRLSELETLHANKEAERASLKQQVDAQGLSDHEIQKLTTDRHQLDEANRLTSAKLTEAMQRTLELEVSLSRAFNDVEKLTEQYHASATKLGLLPTGPDGFDDIDFSQDINGSSSTPQGMVPDCTSRIKPALVQLKQTTARGRYADENESIKVEEDLARLADQLSEVNEAVSEAETKYEGMMAELSAAKETQNGFVSTSSSSIDQLSKQIMDLRNHMSGGLTAADQRLQALDNEHVRLLADADRIKAENQDAFANQIESILAYKQHVSTRFDEMLEAIRST